MVAGTEERCRLEWRTPPSTECSPDDPDWSTCPCMGFAFGERGDLVLVRKKRGKAEERLALAPYFSGDFDRQGKNQEAVLRRWDVRAKDLEGQDSPDFVARVCARPIAGVMRLCDYNHDGQATEFILQVGTYPCGKKMGVAVGVSRRTPRLQAFTTIEHPDRPLVLNINHWEALLRAESPIRVVSGACLDHGSDMEIELELKADGGGIHATENRCQCTSDGRRGPLLSKEIR